MGFFFFFQKLLMSYHMVKKRKRNTVLKQNIVVNQKKSKCKVVSVINTEGPLWNRMWSWLFPKTTATQIVLEYGSDVMSVKKLSKTHHHLTHKTKIQRISWTK